MAYRLSYPGRTADDHRDRVAFAKEDERGICEQMDQTLEEMRQDGTSLKIIEKYLDDPEKYLEVDDLGY